MDLQRVSPDEYDEVSGRVRTYVAGKLSALIESVEPYVVDVPEPGASLVQAYTAALKELGRLYRVYDRPVSDRDVVSVEEAQKRQDAAVAAAVEQALEGERVRVAQERRALEAGARMDVGMVLAQVRERG